MFVNVTSGDKRMAIASNSKAVSWAMAAVVVSVSTSAAQPHSDVLLQQVDGTIVTGAANYTEFSFTLGTRVYQRSFDSSFQAVNPGFAALTNSSPLQPPGAAALPVNTDVGWDFLPMTVDSIVANLLYWDGADLDGGELEVDDVLFGSLAGVSWSIQGEDAIAAADGSDQIVSGELIGGTEFDGSLHEHLLMELIGSDATPPQGVYMIGLRARMAGLGSSAPFVFLLRTSSATPEQLDLAAQWIESHLEVRGDYNQNGVVDAADYTVWRDQLGSTGVPGLVLGDGTGDDLEGLPDGDVDQFDYALWRANFGSVALFSAVVGGAAAQAGIPANVPEPPALVLAWLAISTLMTRRRHPAIRYYFRCRSRQTCSITSPPTMP
jgi:hypothetical protein